MGNTAFPLLEINPSVMVYACDFAPSAVALVTAHPLYAASGRVTAFVADITGGWVGGCKGAGHLWMVPHSGHWQCFGPARPADCHTHHSVGELRRDPLPHRMQLMT